MDLQEISDRLEITDLITRYTRAIDTADWDGIERWQHVIGQVGIDLAGDEARATAYFTNPMVAKGADGEETLLEVGGYYHHDLMRTAGGWRSIRMVDEIVWSRGF